MGTNSEQDTRFSDKQKKLLKTMKFADVLSEKVDMKKVKLDTIKPWIATKITELLNLEDEVVVEYVFTQLEAPVVDPKMMQINLTGFLNGKNAREFMRELWEYLVSAQANPSGIPDKFIEAKKQELRERELEQGRVSAAIKKTKDSIDQLSVPAQKETPLPPSKIAPIDGRDDRRQSPMRQRRSPFRNRGFRSPQRTFRKSPSPRRANVRRSGSRDGRRSPFDARNGRRSSPYRRPNRRSRSRSSSRSPKRFRGRNSPVAKRSKSPLARSDGVAKVSARHSSSSSGSQSPPVNRRPIPRRRSKSPNRRSRSASSSSSASSRGIRKKSASPEVNKRVSPLKSDLSAPLPRAATPQTVSRPVSGKTDLAQPVRNRPPVVQANNERPVANRNRDRSASRSRSPLARRGRNERPSPPRYRKRSLSPYTQKRGNNLRDRQESPRARVRKNSSSPEAERGNGRPSDAARSRNERSGRSSPPSYRSAKPEATEDRIEKKVPDSSTERSVKKTSTGLEQIPKPEVAVVSRDSPSPAIKVSGNESADGKEESPAKKPKKAKKDKKHKKHKKHRKEKKASKHKEISSEDEGLEIEKKLRARALECMRQEDRRSN